MFKNIIKCGFINFIRAGSVSWMTTLTLTLVFSVFLAIILLNVTLDFSLQHIKDKINITVYFNPEAPEDKVITLKGLLENLPEVENVSYISSDEALKIFKERHIGDYAHLQTLKEINRNPFNASLIIKTKEISQYENIESFLKSDGVLSSNSSSIIYKIDYKKNKQTIDNLEMFINNSRKFAFLLTIFLMIVAVLIIFNATWLTAFINKEEANTMCMLGVSNSCIIFPFMITNIIYSIIAGLLSLVAFGFIASWFGENMTSFFNFNFYDYYIKNIWQISLIIFAAGIPISIISSLFSIKKYLNK